MSPLVLFFMIGKIIYIINTITKKGEYNTMIENNTQENNVQPKPLTQCEPLTMWQYFGYHLLFAIPIVGMVFLIIFSFFKTDNVHVTNLSRGFLLQLAFAIIIMAILIGCGLLTAGTLFNAIFSV